MLSAGCATSGTASDSAGSEKQVSDVLRSSDEKKAPNQYGWDDSNCAHITADGTCTHEL